ncbi:MAG: hypothetical protein ACI83P_001648 [Janthinobacterium sp.]|jgi:hypothetical protein
MKFQSALVFLFLRNRIGRKQAASAAAARWHAMHLGNFGNFGRWRHAIGLAEAESNGRHAL